MANSIFWLLIEWPTRGSRLDNYAIHKRHTSAIVRVRPSQRRIMTAGLLQARISLLSLGYCVQPKLFLISTSLLSHCSANSFINVNYRVRSSDKVSRPIVITSLISMQRSALRVSVVISICNKVSLISSHSCRLQPPQHTTDCK